MDERKLPIGIQSFKKLREQGFVYVDKTALVHRLARASCPCFLSRPRRFGKSLLVSTLEAYFLGRRDLFAGLAIDALETEWARHPVLTFSLAGGEFTQPDGLRAALRHWLEEFENTHGLSHDEPSLAVRFQNALKNAADKTGRPVVVLVDEYDNPLLKALDAPGQEQANRDLYKGFFAALKDCDAYLRFVLFTGVTKFSKVSIFSDLNQLQDITMHPDYATLCGITQQELERDFAPEVERMAQANGMTVAECLGRLARMYDGYHFTKNAPGIYNPYSLISAFSSKDFGRYWFGTGTPTFLAKRLWESGFDPRRLSDGTLYTSEAEISDYRPDNPDVVPLLYQSGYLTLTGYDTRHGRYKLGYPNDEVKYGFTQGLAPVYLHNASGSTGTDVFAIDDALESGDMDTLRNQFTALFARLPYVTGGDADKMLERDFQNVIYLVFLLLGQFVHVEQHSARGRADCIVETESRVLIFEFKRDGSADEALMQIDNAGYATPYAADCREVTKIGAVFDSTTRTISEWKVS